MKNLHYIIISIICLIVIGVVYEKYVTDVSNNMRFKCEKDIQTFKESMAQEKKDTMDSLLNLKKTQVSCTNYNTYLKENYVILSINNKESIDYQISYTDDILIRVDVSTDLLNKLYR